MEAVLQLFAPTERDKTKNVLDEQVLARNQAYYREVHVYELKAKIFYGSYFLMFVREAAGKAMPKVRIYPIIQIAGHFYMTNDLQDDPVFQYLAMKYAQSLNTP